MWTLHRTPTEAGRIPSSLTPAPGSPPGAHHGPKRTEGALRGNEPEPGEASPSHGQSRVSALHGSLNCRGPTPAHGLPRLRAPVPAGCSARPQLLTCRRLAAARQKYSPDSDSTTEPV